QKFSFLDKTQSLVNDGGGATLAVHSRLRRLEAEPPYANYNKRFEKKEVVRRFLRECKNSRAQRSGRAKS
ncbi:hypothetical protein ACTGVI_12480, partial [Streptococcus suis]